MFRRFGIFSFRRGASATYGNEARSKQSFNGISNRYQSSFTFLNNQSLLRKDQVKQSKRRNRKSVYKNEEEEERLQQKKCTVELGSSHEKRPKKHDYSWLPRVPSTGHLKPRDISTKVLYSGYRPLFINSEKSCNGGEMGQNGTTLYEFAMKLEDLSDQTPWMTSAAGLEFYNEWDNVPVDLRKNLKPFEPPKAGNEEKSTEMNALRKIREEIYIKERDKVINRKKGRKKPVVTLLRLKQKLDRDN